MPELRNRQEKVDIGGKRFDRLYLPVREARAEFPQGSIRGRAVPAETDKEPRERSPSTHRWDDLRILFSTR